MSSNMTRDEAKTVLYNAINSAWEYESEEGGGEAMEALAMRNQALSVLAPVPRDTQRRFWRGYE